MKKSTTLPSRIKARGTLSRNRSVAIILSLILILIVAVMWMVWPENNETWPQQILEDGANKVAFVHNDTCVECHPQQIADWLGSHHQQAMQVADAQTVLGDFDNTTFTDFEVTSRFFKSKDKFFINTQGADGKFSDFEVKYTFGITPLQQYLLEFPNGQLQAFTVAWDTAEQQWFNLYPDKKIEPNDPLHWSRRWFTWNSSCAECHSTNLELNYNLETNSYKTTWSEISVGCQACHGPGRNHLKWAEQEDDQDQSKGLTVDYQTLNSNEQVETCAPCHARRYAISPHDQADSPLLDDFMPELVHTGLYHADGQILDEVYVYGSFTQSKMYQQGVSCTDCHNPHTLKLQRPGNDLCTACHQSNPPVQQFNTLTTKNYDTTAHHFHPTDSTGAQCVNCHMPTTTYMIIDPRRDHRLSIPRPDLSVTLNTPNACNQCHTDETTQWAVDIMLDWYGPQWQQTPTYAHTIAAGRVGEAEAATPLIAMVNDPDQPDIMRATALDLLSQYGELGRDTTIAAIIDESPLIRAIATQNLTHLPAQIRLEIFPPLLDDPIRAVRIEAAKGLASANTAQLDEAQRLKLAAALTEYQDAQLLLADHPEGHLNLGQLYTVMGQPELAEQAYKTAIKRDVYFFPAYNNLANLYFQLDRYEEAEAILQQALDSTGDQGILYYSLGLLLAEQERFDEALEIFDKAIVLMPTQPRVHYNYGLLHQQLNQTPEAEAAFLKAYELSVSDPDILYALATFYTQQNDWDQANIYAQELIELYPDVPQFQQVFELVQEELSAK